VPGSEFEFTVTQSVFDRLLDLEPGSVRDESVSRHEGVNRLRQAVRRDLEHLLNTRNPFPDLSPEFAEAGQSVLAYGVADFAAFNVLSVRDQGRLRQLIERSIRTFEPRLTGVTVSILPMGQTERSLRLHVDARLMMDPVPEPVAFDVVMPQLSSRCEVKEK